MGLSIGDYGVHAVEVEWTGETPTLRAIDEWQHSLPMGEEITTADGLSEFREYLATFIKLHHVGARRVSVALDTSYLFLNTIPMVDKISPSERTDQVQWELQQYLPGNPPAGYITAYHTMVHDPPERDPEILCVSIRRNDVRAIRTILQDLGLSLHIVDVDHFSGDMALRVNYPDSYRRFLSVVGVKKNRLDISWLRNGNLEAYRYRPVGSAQDIVNEIGRISTESTGIHAMTVYGPYLNKELLAMIRRKTAVLVEAMNPLRHVNIADTLRLAESIQSPSYRFAAAIGVALRKD